MNYANNSDQKEEEISTRAHSSAQEQERKPTLDITCSSLLFAASFVILTAFMSSTGLPILVRTHSPFLLGIYPLSFRIDGLATLFVSLLSILSIAISLYSPGYLNHLGNRINKSVYWAAFLIFVAAMYGVVLSADAVTFTVLWEIMSLSSALLVASDHLHRVVQKSALIYLGATRIATAFLFAGFLCMHAITGSWSFSDWSFSTVSSYLPATLILLAFCIKGGIWPFHLWLPYAHPAAPATVSALMSGFMIKIAVYGIFRILVCGNLHSSEVANLALVLGFVSTFWGIIFALVKNDLKRLLAYSSIENIGMILIAIAFGLKARISNLPEIAAICFVGAVLHCINHGLFKSLLFMCAGSVDARAHSRDLRQLGGLARLMPWTATCFFIGCFAICSIPPFNGFSSKWMVYQALFTSTYQCESFIDRSIAFAGVCLLSVVGGLALATFVKAAGVSFLGIPRTKNATKAGEATRAMITAQCLLVALCVATGLFAGELIKRINNLLAKTQNLESLSTSQLCSGKFFYIPVEIVAVLLLSLSAMIYLMFLRPSKPREFITWDCGFGQISPKAQVSSDSFSQPIARIFRPIFRYSANLKIEGHDHRHFPERLNVDVQIVSLLESHVYLPTLAVLDSASKFLAKLQAGSIHLYLLYVCLTLLLLLVLGTNL